MEPARGEGPETPEQDIPEAGITPPANGVPAVPGRSYAVGDTVYLENDKPYVIESIDYDIRLRDPSLTYPITRSESRESFERLLLRNPNNKQFTDYLAADLDNVNGDLRDVLENGLLAPAFKADITELIGAGAPNDELANYLSGTFPREVYSITLETGETADYSTTPQGISIEVLDKYDTTLGFSWAEVAPIVRALSSEWEREPERGQPEPAAMQETQSVNDPPPEWDEYYMFSPEQRAAYAREYAAWLDRNRPATEHFVVYELPNRAGVYAVWDNENRRFYEDENGNIETFTDQAEAES